jgi:hypothetical protein
MKTLLLPHLYPVSRFAKAKKVTRQAVWGRINNGDITPVHIGVSKDPYIDWTMYKDFAFDMDKKKTSKKSLAKKRA